MKTIEEKMKSLPKWAQDYIKDLVREREVSIRTLNEAVDGQTPSHVYYEDNPCTGEKVGPVGKRFYIQSNWIYVEFAGVHLQILLREGRNEIDLQWEDEKDRCEVALIPSSHQSARLVAKQHMR